MNVSRVNHIVPFKGTNVLAIGSDIVHIPRVERMLLRNGPKKYNRIMKKFMHQREIDQFQAIQATQDTRAQATYLSGIWAIKESLFKCLPDAKTRPPAIHIYTKLGYKSKNNQGKPIFNIDQDSFVTTYTEEYWNTHLASTRFVLSLSHDQDYLVCFMMHLEN